MEKKSPQLPSLTVEEAVAVLINFDYIPTGFSLLDMTLAFFESADVEHHNAKLDHVPEAKLDALLFRKTACMARHSLAISLIEHLKNELNDPEKASSLLSADSATERRISVEGLMSWASENYGIGVVPAQVPTSDSRGFVQASDGTPCWEDVEIRIYANDKIAYSVGNGPFSKSSFQEIGLIDRRTNEPNWQGGLLLGFTRKKKFPAGKIAEGKDKTALSKLRRALNTLTGISSDPFCPFNEDDGWKPLFKLVDARKSADNRARDNAIHVEFDEERHSLRDFDDENDAGGKWYQENS